MERNKLNLGNIMDDEPKIKNTLAEKHDYTKDFQWEGKFFEHMNKTTFNYAKSLVNAGLIKDVYLDRNDEDCHYIVIEYLFNCKDDLKDITKAVKRLQQEKPKVEKFRIPYKFEITSQTGCKNKYEYDCQFYGCPIIIAGYIFHHERNLHKAIKDPNKPVDTNKKEEKKETLKDILTPELVTRRNDILMDVNNNIYLDAKIKEEFCRIIRTLDNYDRFKDSLDFRPVLNYAFTDNTDTIHPLCAGQEECINQYLRILKY